MARSASEAFELVPTVISYESPPIEARTLLIEIVKTANWFNTSSEAEECAERLQLAFLVLLRREYNSLAEDDRICLYEFAVSSDTIVQGSAYIAPGIHDPEVEALRRQRGHIARYLAKLDALSPREFEGVCRGILSLLGSDSPTLTVVSRDEGIDFYGRLTIQVGLQGLDRLPGLHRRLAVWIVGQAKHFKQGQVATADIRDLVGAVNLARSRAYGSGSDKYADLQLKVCDPVFFLFLTTGRISPDGWRVSKASGVVVMEGPDVAAFLADHRLALSEAGELDDQSWDAWVKSSLGT